MQIYKTVTFPIEPCSVVWKENDATKARVFIDQQAATTFFVENNLWGNDGLIFGEGGEPIPPPGPPNS